jgi:hypothetical protein
MALIREEPEQTRTLDSYLTERVMTLGTLIEQASNKQTTKLNSKLMILSIDTRIVLIGETALRIPVGDFYFSKEQLFRAMQQAQATYFIWRKRPVKLVAKLELVTQYINNQHRIARKGNSLTGAYPIWQHNLPTFLSPVNC